jgi:two-component system, OmpR family, response regulator RstA
VSALLADLRGSSDPSDAVHAVVARAAELPRVAVVAAATPIAAAWCDALRAEGLHVELDSEPRVAQAVVLFCAQRVAAHLSALRELREGYPRQAVVVVCPELRELEQVLALEMGADDAIDARTGAAVVAARLRALWRRNALAPGMAPEHLHFGRLSLQLRERSVQLGAERIALTECEFEVLWLLATQAGRAVSRTELLERLRGLPYQRIDRSIDCRIYRLRAKLAKADGQASSAAQRIRTVRNCGYLFSLAPW